MKNVRLIYEKKDRMRFVSHLDMTRFMSRMIQKSKIPVWYTEGFNKHIYVTFALPLSLGFESNYEVMDFRFDDDNYPLSLALQALESVFPPYIRIVDLIEPQMKAGEIAFADFEITFDTADKAFEDRLEGFLNSAEIKVSKKSKKGAISEVDIAPKIKAFSITQGEDTVLKITLPAGGKDNVNPQLVLSAMGEALPEYKICRGKLYNEKMEVFK